MIPNHCTRNPSDEELACRAREGCAVSFEHLVRRFQAPVLHFLQHRGAGADAEDVLQETWIRAYQNLGSYRARWRFATWLFTIARRASINHSRRRTPSSNESSSDDALSSMASRVPGPHDAVAGEEDRQRLWSAAARILSEEELTAVWLYYVEEFSTREIAAVLERSWVAVKAMLYRARKRLLPLLEDLQSDRRLDETRPCRERTRAPESPGVEAPYV